MAIDLEELKKLASNIESKVWHWDADPIKGDPLGRSRYRITTAGRTITQTYYSDVQAVDEAKYIAAANPSTILELIAEIEMLRNMLVPKNDFLNGVPALYPKPKPGETIIVAERPSNEGK